MARIWVRPSDCLPVNSPPPCTPWRPRLPSPMRTRAVHIRVGPRSSMISVGWLPTLFRQKSSIVLFVVKHHLRVKFHQNYMGWSMPALLDGLIMAGLGLIWATWMYLLSRAYSLAKASVAAPFDAHQHHVEISHHLARWHTNRLPGAGITARDRPGDDSIQKITI